MSPQKVNRRTEELKNRDLAPRLAEREDGVKSAERERVRKREEAVLRLFGSSVRR
jgi:hypothetical protein